MAESESQLDRVYRALAAEERRLAVACLQSHQELTLPDLAELVVERQRDTDLASVSGERVRDTYFLLYHNHVPILEECGLIRYRQDDDMVVASPTLPDALDRLRADVESLNDPADGLVE
ncbi:DUF7344 domain-containing protein [Haloarcula marina]|uniref:DUF7344 domain-containing protein n=1 Tax=Haloarcula marina TaxID=2961574 RepID=UPI0020B71163|nr:hypothetical protein [Halomicroarcula marina]